MIFCKFPSFSGGFRWARGGAPGYRDVGTDGRLGDLMVVGNYGYSWSVATKDITGMDLNLSTRGLNPGSTNYRGYGFQLRCLSE
ncbi:hypothetical protein [uncultured Rikenella sp.]|uniref:hypothetical protein n=1 Tax=uncultured Rikenella sp. TaxID=368003 RepID=UPI00262C73AA|nr:hypothetical protein [uncultured Rikenella sp.]